MAMLLTWIKHKQFIGVPILAKLLGIVSQIKMMSN